jgi:DNA-binding transcriptional LysR family regulator
LENIDDMILFAEVADCGSFTKAGVRLGIPKSTVSQRISQLEARLGLRLLNRSTRTVTLTGSGLVYVEHCRRVRAEAALATMAMSHLKDQPVGALRITCPEVTASYFMPGFLQGFSAQFPKIEIEVLATNENLDIIQERIDFAFRVGSVSGQDFIVRTISSIRRIPVASPDYLSSAAPIAYPDDLLQHRCLVHAAYPEWSFTKGAKRSAIHPPAAMKSDSMGFLLQASVAGSGIALLPAYISADYRAAGALVELLQEWQVPAHQMSLIFPNRDNHSKAQTAFRAYVDSFDFSRLSSTF